MYEHERERASLCSETATADDRARVASTLDGLETIADGDGTVVHVAALYESRRERFAAVVPFLREGLHADERCVYIGGDGSRAAVTRALEDGDVDVEAALARGCLSFHHVTELFADDRSPRDVDAVAESLAAEGSPVRLVVDQTRVAVEDGRRESLLRWESRTNERLRDERVRLLCEYDRTELPAPVVEEALRAHPYVAVDGAVSRNVYYRPPAERTGLEPTESDVDRRLEALTSRVPAWHDAERRERYRRAVTDAVSDATRSFEEKLDAMFAVGREWFGTDVGTLAKVDAERDHFEVERVMDDGGRFRAGQELALSDTLCQLPTAEQPPPDTVSEPVDVVDPAAHGLEDVRLVSEFGLDSYVGVYIRIPNGTDRTFAFLSTGSRDRPLSGSERTFHRQMAQWIRHELVRRNRERYLRAGYETTADPSLSFDEKLEQLIDVGREWFDLEMAGVNRLAERGDRFSVEKTVGFDPEDSDDCAVGAPESGQFCLDAVGSETPVARTDVRGTSWENDPVYRSLGITCYLGTQISVGSLPYGTLWFGSAEGRERPFSFHERTFLDLMAQWIGEELGRRRQRRSERSLSEITADAELSAEETVDRLLDVACERLGLPYGVLISERENERRAVQVRGDPPNLAAGDAVPGDAAPAGRLDGNGDPVVTAGDVAAGDVDDPLCSEGGFESCAGVSLSVGGEPFGTLYFLDTDARSGSFTADERSFLELLSRCASYELERSRRETQLSTLSELGRELLTTETPAEIAADVVDVAESAYDTVAVAVALYDEADGELRTTAATEPGERLLAATDVVGGVDSAAAEAFMTGEPVRLDLDAATTPEPSPVSEAACHPLGAHGVLVVGPTDNVGFRRGDEGAMGTVAATIRAALDRVDREEELRDREAALESKTESLERLRRINGTIRRVGQGLVEASTQAEIERVVCETLTENGPYELAWVGEHDSQSGVTVKESAGNDDGYLEAVAVGQGDDAGESLPFERALERGEPVVVDDVLADRSFTPWRREALDRGYHAIAALPVTSERRRCGVLCLYAGEPGTFDGLEREVLTELSNTVGDAMNAVEERPAVDDRVVDLAFTVTGQGSAGVEMARDLGCDVNARGIVHGTDGDTWAFFELDGASAEGLLEHESRLPGSDLTVIASAEDSCLYRVRPTERSITGTVVQHGGRLRHITTDDDEATVVVRMPADGSADAFAEAFEREQPDGRLDERRERRLSDPVVGDYADAATGSLTARQEEVLRTAHYCGYFEEPRQTTGVDVADQLDISQPTFSSHLRSATRKLCETAFERELDG